MIDHCNIDNVQYSYRDTIPIIFFFYTTLNIRFVYIAPWKRGAEAATFIFYNFHRVVISRIINGITA